MKKRVFIIHGWEGNPSLHWIPWLKMELEKKGYEAVTPQMPNTMTPDFNSWVGYLHKIITDPNENTVLVGHSLGCITILRYIESLKKEIKVGGAVFVAGFGINLSYYGYKNELSSFFKTPVMWNNIKKHCEKFVAINSKDDPYVGIKNSDLFKQKLNARTIVHEKRGHYNAKDSVIEFPELLNIILGL